MFFSIDRVQVQALHEFLVQVASNQSPIELTPSSTTYFESNNDRVLVQLYQQQESLHALHTKLTTTLEADYHITFNNPEYSNEGYMPHETLDTSPELVSQQNIIIDNLALIDMFPHKNGYMRRVVMTLPFGKHTH
ncbi:MAG: hypothetical protein U0491_00095 [Candidatus Saccharimonadales bacterium]